MKQARAKPADRVVEVVHRRSRRRRPRKLEHLLLDRRAAVGRGVRQRHRARAGNSEIGGLVLVAERVAADHDRLGPVRDEPGHVVQMIGSRKMVPSRMLRMVPLGDCHIFLRLNSFTRASSGVMVAHFTATPYCLVAFGRVEGHLVVGRVAVLDAEVEVLEVDVEVRQDQLLA